MGQLSNSAAERIDPTRTVVLRRAFSRYYTVVWQRIAKRIAEYLEAAQVGYGIAAQVLAFNRAVRAIVDDEMRVAQSDRQYGTEALIMAGYLRGLQRADWDMQSVDTYMHGTPQQAIYQPQFREEISLLGIMLASQLSGVADAAVSAIQQAYAQAITIGASVAEQIRQIKPAIKKTGIVRSAAAVRTAIVRSFNNAILSRYESMGGQVVGVVPERNIDVTGTGDVRYQSVNDERRCKVCEKLTFQDNGFGEGLYSIDQARGLVSVENVKAGEPILPRHANCRCRWKLPSAPSTVPRRNPGDFGIRIDASGILFSADEDGQRAFGVPAQQPKKRR